MIVAVIVKQHLLTAVPQTRITPRRPLMGRHGVWSSLPSRWNDHMVTFTRRPMSRSGSRPCSRNICRTVGSTSASRDSKAGMRSFVVVIIILLFICYVCAVIIFVCSICLFLAAGLRSLAGSKSEEEMARRCETIFVSVLHAHCF